MMSPPLTSCYKRSNGVWTGGQTFYTHIWPQRICQISILVGLTLNQVASLWLLLQPSAIVESKENGPTWPVGQQRQPLVWRISCAAGSDLIQTKSTAGQAGPEPLHRQSEAYCCWNAGQTERGWNGRLAEVVNTMKGWGACQSHTLHLHLKTTKKKNTPCGHNHIKWM